MSLLVVVMIENMRAPLVLTQIATRSACRDLRTESAETELRAGVPQTATAATPGQLAGRRTARLVARRQNENDDAARAKTDTTDDTRPGNSDVF